MSTTQPPRPSQPAPSTPTRQLLDELDELMQRMLQLPVHQVADEPDAPAGTEVVPTVAPPPPLKNPAARELPPTPEADPPSEPQPAPRILPSPPKPASISPPLDARERPHDRTPAIPPLPPAAPTTTRLPLSYLARNGRPPSPPQRSQFAWYLQPLLWSNRTFDRCTTWLGGPGRWLRSESGRTVLGWSGLLLLTIALAWGLLKWFANG